jgi:hypothetical protein
MGLLTRDFFLKFQSCHFWGALSDERSGLSCVSLVFQVYSRLSVRVRVRVRVTTSSSATYIDPDPAQMTRRKVNSRLYRASSS